MGEKREKAYKKMKVLRTDLVELYLAAINLPLSITREDIRRQFLV